ncbi:MAG: Gfo/Idh/MocA family oxidoreductase [Candidatus Aminicenantales bacterium]
MEKHQMTRRDFVKAASAATAAAVLKLPSLSSSRVLGSNERIRVGIVGFSDRARYSLIPAFLHLAPELNFEITAVSDIWKLRREEAAAFFKEKMVREPAVFRNNEEMYESGKVEAVIISTADFQHALHTVEAVEAGCDVYVEKPFANTMEDVRTALAAVTGSDRVVQVGTQRRSDRSYILADEFIRSGRFGEIVAVEMTWNVNQPGRWRRPQLVNKARPEDVDWKRYLLNRSDEPWNPRKYVEYRLFWPYSSGIPCQWMVHQIDTVHWFTGLPRPRSVVVNGGIYLWKDGRQNYDTLAAVFDYGPLADKTKGFQVTYSSRMTNSYGGTKEIYFSNGGTLNLETNKVTPEGGLAKEQAEVMGLAENRLSEVQLAPEGGVVTAAVTGTDSATLAHMRNWMECVRGRKTPAASIRAAYDHSVALCMTIAAMHTGKRVGFDDSRQAVIAG